MKTFFSLLFVASTLTAMACSSSEGTTPPDASPDASADASPASDASPAPDAALPTCAAKGGACTAVVPGACTNGTVDTAVSDCGAGQVGASCCIPNAKTTCASLGGTCTPVTPGACAGTVDVRGDCGGVGASCCIAKPPPKPSCASRGGTCVPVVPNACAGGTLDPNADCGAGVGVTCCLMGDAG